MNYKRMKNRTVIIGLILSLIILSSESTFSQKWLDAVSGNFEGNFYEAQQDFNNYIMKRGPQDLKGWKQYKRWEYFMEPRVYPTGTLPDPTASWKAMNDYYNKNKRGSTRAGSAGSWISIGPSVSSGTGIGRINFVCFHPTEPNTIFIGAPSGGLWKTTNNGVTWTTNTDNLPVIGFTDMIINPDNVNVMYLASSDGDASDTYSIGVLKSYDGGQTWDTTGLIWDVSQARRISKLLMDPNDTSLLYAATSNGIFKTIDGGDNWNRILSGNYKDIEFKPGNSSVIYVAGTGFYRSVDSGDNFTKIDSGITTATVKRIAMAVTEADSDYIYLLVAQSNNSFEGLYKSEDGGTSFTIMSDSPNILGWAANGSGSGGQGWYDLAIAASPTNKNEIYTGGVNIWKSEDGGANWELNAHWTGGGGAPWVHADIHAIEFYPGSSTTIYVGCDGGVFKTDNNGETWSDLSQSLVISQIYKLGVSATDPDIVLIGLQDNGTKRYNPEWDNVIGGDGMECLVDYTNSNYMYGSIYYGDIRRSTNAGNSFIKVAGNNTNGITESGGWITPYVINPLDPKILYAGYINVWKTENRGNLWTKISDFGGSKKFNTLVVAPSDTNILYASKGTTIYRTIDGGDNWDNINNNLPDNSITYIEVHEANPGTVWITLSGYSDGEKVYQSVDSGETWINISGSLPNLPANCIEYQNGSNYALYVGMDVGAYYKDSTMNDWVPFTNGLPNVIVNELEIYYDSDTTKSRIKAATYGRGLWESELYFIPNTKPVADFEASERDICEGYSVKFSNNSNYSNKWEWLFAGGTPSTSTELNPTVQYFNHGVYNVTLTSSNDYDNTTLTKTSYIIVDSSKQCIYIMSKTTSGESYGSCLGKLYDPGGIYDYQSYTDVYAVIAPPGATGLLLEFIEFDLEKDFDYLHVYDGPEIVSANLIGSYTGSELPGGGVLICPSGAATLHFISDKGTTRPGFEIDWTCMDANSPPFAGFTSNSLYTCIGDIQFIDNTIGSPTSWLWDFGDRTATSTQQNPTHIYTRNGIYTVKLIATNNNGKDSFTYTDMIRIDIPLPILTPDASCSPAVLTLKATVNGKINWYDAPTGGTLVNTGTEFTTPFLNETKTYYVQTIANGPSQYVGKGDILGGGMDYSGSQGLIFDVHKQLTLVSALVYANGAKERNIQLKDKNGVNLIDTMIYLPLGDSRIKLNFKIPPGNDYELWANDADMYRNNGGVEYPYKIDGLVTIKKSTSSLPSTTYFFFYDWEVTEGESCYSPRLPILASINSASPTANFNYSDYGLEINFFDASVDGIFYLWDFGDSTTDISANPIHRYAEDGVYIVKLKVTNGCGSDSIRKTINVANSIQSNTIHNLAKVYPNPNTGEFTLEYTGSDLISFRIIDLRGNLLMSKEINYSPVNSTYKRKLNLIQYPKGVYFVQLLTSKGIIVKKIFIE